MKRLFSFLGSHVGLYVGFLTLLKALLSSNSSWACQSSHFSIFQCLNLPPTTTQEEVEIAYYDYVLRVHPDFRSQESEALHRLFALMSEYTANPNRVARLELRRLRRLAVMHQRIHEEFSSCSRGRNPLIPSLKTLKHQLGSITEDTLSSIKPECSVNFYMSVINGLKPINEAIESIFWTAIENHVTTPAEVIQQAHMTEDSVVEQMAEGLQCSKQCQSSTLNSVYESFLAKNILIFEKKYNILGIRDLYEKIFQELHRFLGRDFENMKTAWRTEKRYFYPVAQKIRYPQEYLLEVLENKSDVPLIQEFFLESYGVLHRRKVNQFAREGFAIEPTLKLVQDHCYHSSLSSARGVRKQTTPGPKTRQVGIVRELNIPELIINKEDRPWIASGTEMRISRSSSNYTKNVTRLQIPLVCGISGNTNIALWSLLSLNVKFTPMQLRAFLLSLWATVCADGGHSLQEVLSATKLVSDYIEQHKSQLQGHIPEELASSLKEVTKDLSADGEDPANKFGSYYDGILKDVERDYPRFSTVRKAAQAEFNHYYQSSVCNH